MPLRHLLAKTVFVLRWVFTVVVVSYGFAACACIPILAVGVSPGALLASAAILAVLTVGSWLLLRSRVEVPAYVWPLVSINFVLNLWAIATVLAVFRYLNPISPEAATVMVADFPYATSKTALAHRLVLQGSILATATLSFLLRRRGPVLKTPRARLLVVSALAALALTYAALMWYFVVVGYGMAGILGANTTARAGQTVEAAGGAASVTVPSGWSAEVFRSAPPPPRWLFVPKRYLATDEHQGRVMLKSQNRSVIESIRTDGLTVLLVFRSESEMRRSVDATRGSPYELPMTGAQRAPDAAFIERRNVDSGGWKTYIRAYYFDERAPMELVITIPHSSAATPSAEVIRSRLAPFRIRDTK